MSVIKFDRDFSTLFNWDTDENPTTEQDYQNAVKNWTETEMNIVDTLLWQPTTEYTTGNIVKTPSLPSQYVLRCAEAGTSGSTEPSYSGASVGDTVTDGTVEWVIVSLATGNAADVDASNIGVNAEVDNSEAWASAIGGGAIAEDDGRLVTGDTVYAVTSVMETNIATNTEAIEDNTEAIATNTANIEASAVKIDIDDKRISNIEKLLQGNLYDYQTDTDSKYTKTVLAGAMPYASLDSIGGKTLVMNQKANSINATYWQGFGANVSVTYADGVAECTLQNDTASAYMYGLELLNAYAYNIVDGHKYYYSYEVKINITGTKFFNQCVTSAGINDGVIDTANIWIQKNNIVTATAVNPRRCLIYPSTNLTGLVYSVRNAMVVDLTLLFGAGNEPSTVEEFTAQFPASYYPYNAGTLLSAGVTEVVSHSTNLFNGLMEQGSFTSNGGLPIPSANSVRSVNYIPLDVGTYVLSAKCTASAFRMFYYAYDLDGQYRQSESKITATTNKTITISNANRKVRIGLAKSETSGTPTSPSDFSDIQIEKGTTPTEYKNPIIATYPIPAEIQALEGYGWSAGSVYNYIDYERKVFVQNVARVDLGTLNWQKVSATDHELFYATVIGLQPAQSSETYGNVVCANYTTSTYTDVYNHTADNTIALNSGTYNRIAIYDSMKISMTTTDFKTAMSGVYAYYELATPIETDISAYLTDDNLISVESGGTLTFPNSNGTDYQIPVPSAETYMVDLQSALGE